MSPFEPMYPEPEQTDEQRLEQLKEKAYEHLRTTIRHGISHMAASGDTDGLVQLHAFTEALFMRADVALSGYNEQDGPDQDNLLIDHGGMGS